MVAYVLHYIAITRKIFSGQKYFLWTKGNNVFQVYYNQTVMIYSLPWSSQLTYSIKSQLSKGDLILLKLCNLIMGYLYQNPSCIISCVFGTKIPCRKKTSSYLKPINIDNFTTCHKTTQYSVCNKLQPSLQKHIARILIDYCTFFFKFALWDKHYILQIL